MNRRAIMYCPVLWVGALFGVFVACGPTVSEEPEAELATSAAEVRIPASNIDGDALRNISRQLAGLPTDAESELDEPWVQHGEQMTEIWGEIEERHLSAMRTWAAAELEPIDPKAPLLYPFSGPDLPSALQFFPHAQSYVLVGLEAPGRIPDLTRLTESLDDDGLTAELDRLRTGLDNLMTAGYFVTKRMETDFVASHLEGTLPFLYIFLARAGMTPTAVHYVSLERDGQVRVQAADALIAERAATAVRIDFETDGQQRSLYYFSRDLSNTGLESKPSFVAFLQRLGAFNVYLKSASYLLHMDDFTSLQALLLARAGAVLQDDSGIPLRDFSPVTWERRFFGTYSQTLPSYREWFQDDLRAAYERVDQQQGGLRLLPFAIGYHSKTGGSCLIWAQRRASE